MHLLKKKKDEIERKEKKMQKNLIDKNLEEEMKDSQYFTIEKSVFIEAWAKYRPTSNHDSPDEKGSKNAKKRGDIYQILGEDFIEKLHAGIKQKRDENRLNY